MFGLLDSGFGPPFRFRPTPSRRSTSAILTGINSDLFFAETYPVKLPNRFSGLIPGAVKQVCLGGYDRRRAIGIHVLPGAGGAGRRLEFAIELNLY